MLDKRSFRTIRSFDGSQQAAFEELICQLAHLDPPHNAKSFVRKEGAGGDAGVECFWIMADGSEHAWQAKYFLDSIKPSNWTQIDESVEKALEKHPRLTKYYVCVPVDRADTRSTGPLGRQKISVLSEWNKHVRKWKTIAANRGMRVEFEYWGAHEILMPLQSDDPRYSGRAFFWFNAVVLTNDKLAQCMTRQQKTIGERYTPEFHVELPIAHTLKGVVNGDEFWKELNRIALKWNKERSTFFGNQPPVDLHDRFGQLRKSLDSCKLFVDSVVLARSRDRLVELQRQVYQVTLCLYEFEKACGVSGKATKKPNKHSRSFHDEVIQFVYYKHSELSSFLNSDIVKANISSAILVTGEAGAGKSHLLCDFAIGLVKTGRPAILMLGQHYRGGNPLTDLLDLLDLTTHSYDTVLGALDAAGEAARSNAILVIDAINEGSYRDEWKERLIGLLEDAKKFPHIGIVISCRSLFVELLIPPHLEETNLLRVSHEGFRGHEHKAASMYLSGHGIAKPTTPVTAPEFSNPLFLKTCATALKQLGQTIWPKGYQGSSRLFDIYLSSLERVVSNRRQTEVNDRLCQKALEAVANAMFPNNLSGLPWDDATAIVNAIDTCVNPKESLLQTLLREGALAEDVELRKGDDGTPKRTVIVRFAYERFYDQFVAQKLIRGIEDPNEIFAHNRPLGTAIKEQRNSACLGILSALSVIIPEKFSIEFWDILPPTLKSQWTASKQYFFDSLPFRAPSSFSDRTRDLFDSLPLPQGSFQNQRLDLLVQFATEPTHPWNAEELHRMLSAKAMPDRDALWSIYVAKNDYEEEYTQPESPIRSLIDWATFGDLAFLRKDQARLSLIALIWFTTTTNRKTRDQATKAAARLFAKEPTLVVSLLTQFRDIDDLYLQERIYASAYGGLCNTFDDDTLKSVAKHVFEVQFEEGAPVNHLLLRDYARGILELAEMRACNDESIEIDKCRPAYASEWPLENLSEGEFKSSGNSIAFSVFTGDFGTYTIRSVQHWSPTSRFEPNPESQSQCLEKLVSQLNSSSRKLFNNAVEATKSLEARRLPSMRFSGHQAEDRTHIHSVSCGDGEGFFPIDLDLASMPVSAAVPSESTSERDEVTGIDAESAWREFNSSLSQEEKEAFRWAQGFWRNGEIIASFSGEWAKRWVFKRAMSLGWTPELFDEFEKSLRYAGYGGERSQVERIGKKYQRIAFHTFLAHLADNLHYKDDEIYRGPWQPWERDIDPTHWLRSTSSPVRAEEEAAFWWRPFEYSFALASDEEKLIWCKDPADLPKFQNHAKVRDKTAEKHWYVLRGLSQWRDREISGDVSTLARSVWFRINSVIVKKRHLSRLKRELESKDYISPDLVNSTSTGHQVYLRECPWHASVSIVDRYNEDEAREIKTPHMIPYAQYEWEQGSGDQSTGMNLSFYMPSEFLIEEMDLRFDGSRFDHWRDASGKTVFIDPSLEHGGSSHALVDCGLVDEVLADNKLVLVWLIGGEKMIVDNSNAPVKSRMVFSTLLWTEGDGKIHNRSHHHMEGGETVSTQRAARRKPDDHGSGAKR